MNRGSWLVFVAVLVGCSPSASESRDSPAVADGPDAGDGGSQTAAPADDPRDAAAVIPGYRHTREASRFALGTLASETTTNGGHRYVGSDGSILVLPNGAFMARMHAGGGKASYAGTGEAHSETVRTYFVGAGLPSDQVGPTSANAIVGSGFHAYASSIQRRVHDVPVAESRASAQFGDGDRTYAEDVWWPELSNDVAVQIGRYLAILADPAAKADLLTRLPPPLEGSTPQVVVHHASASDETWYADVTFDLMTSKSSPPRSYDALGQEVKRR